MAIHFYPSGMLHKGPPNSVFLQSKVLREKKRKSVSIFVFVFSVCIFLIFVRVQLGGLLTSEVRLG